MPLRPRVALVSILLLAGACGGDRDSPTGPSEQPGGLRRVQGRVTDFASGAPLANTALSFGTDIQALDHRTTTDASGAFSVSLPAGRIHGAIDGLVVADLAVHGSGTAYRGDLLGNGGTCVSRYGLVTDAVTFRPVSGATVRLGGASMVTGTDGWYRIDLGCDIDPLGNFGTALIYVTHPAHAEFSRVVGRGIHFVNRIDIELQRP